MAALLRSLRRVVPLLRPVPRLAPLQFPQTGFEVIPNSVAVEEETFPWYSTDEFYPARIGEVLGRDGRYQLVTKLGYGAYSTAWLARDLSKGKSDRPEYVTVKIATPKAVSRELPALRRLSTITKHPGSQLVRRLLDEFVLEPNNSEAVFNCLVFAPCLCSLRDFRVTKAPIRALPPSFVKPIIKNILLVLDYMHNEAKMIHTDINEGNILFTFSPNADDHDRLLQAAEQQEMHNPTPRKVDGERIIYRSRPLLPKERVYPGYPILTDFGETRDMKDYDPRELVSPDQYRPPEVFFCLPWDEQVDIWCLGMMLFDAMSGRNLIDVAPGPNGEPSNIYGLLQTIALFGPPPLDFLQRVQVPKVWDDFDRATGAWKGKYPIPDRKLEDMPLNPLLEGDDRRLFFKFVRRMLTWRPEDRSTAKELLEDDWLRLEE